MREPIVLRRPVVDFGQEVTSIALRDPRGVDFRRCGAPFKVLHDETLEILPGNIARYIETLGNVTGAAVDQLSAPDFVALQQQVLALFEKVGNDEAEDPAELVEPVEHLEKTITRIEIREPLGKDFRQCGMPFKLHTDESAEPSPRVVARYIARLGGVPPAAVDMLCAQDFLGLQQRVLDFFEDSPARPLKTQAATG